MPEFTDPIVFPAFHELPSSTPSSTDADAGADWFLLAQIKEDMTITKPTVIARDRTGADFAVTFDDGDHRGLASASGGAAPQRFRFRKGHTLVVPRATRTDRGGEGKKAVVRVPAGRGAETSVIPAGLDQVLELGRVVAGIGAEGEGEGGGKKCAACGKVEGDGEGGRPLMRCTGCGAAAYCGKECQVRGWAEMGHKANCKVIKAIKEIWP
ncbi:hypothetical protein GGR54DRAFT_654038 [Hypoxylon sp. NC1633]|nr:hypothetical protein GGR54DRAFT_654038 [Hypoxylon sp. NC1633]